MAKKGPRKAAHLALHEILQKHGQTAAAVDHAIRKCALSPVDAALATQIVYGTLRRLFYLDYVIARHCKKKLKKLEDAVLLALRIGAYQLLYLDRVPAHAAVDESVKLAPKRAAGFVNAILRKVAKYRGDLPAVDIDDPLGRMQVQYSIPKWILQHFIERFGQTGTEKLCEAFQAPPPHVIRANPMIMSRQALLDALAAKGIKATPTTYAPQGVNLETMEQALSTDLMKQGAFQVQGEASQLVVSLLDPKPGERILDACAAPGGKTTLIAAMVGAKGAVTACDVSDQRLTKVRENSMLAGADNVSCLQADLTDLTRDLPGAPFDRILVDAPCSNLGELGKNPDARYAKKPDDVEKLGVTQRRILETASTLLKPGGVLVYSVCTLPLTECKNVIEPFLSDHPEFELERAQDCLDDKLTVFGTPNGYFLAAPHLTGTGGMFAARLVFKGQ